MSTSATSLALPSLRTKTSTCFSSLPSFSLNTSFKPFSCGSLRKTLSLSYRFVSRVAVSSEFGQEEDTDQEDDTDLEEDTFADVDTRSYSANQRLFVGNLPFSVDSAQLAEIFESAGSVEMVEVIYDKTTGRSRGFGFVTMSSAAEVEAAAQQFNGYLVEGRELRVNSGPAPPPRENSRFGDNPRSGRENSRFGDNPRFGRENSRYGDNPRFGRENSRFGDSSGSRGPPRGGGSDSEHRVHVANLAWGVDNTALESLFQEQGSVLEAKVIYDRESGRSRGFGFVSFSSAEEANSAIQSLDGVDLNGRAIRVSPADSRPKPQF